MTITESAQTVKRSRQTLYNYVKSGKLKASRNGKGYEIELDDLLEVFDVSSDSSNFDTSMSTDASSPRVSNEMSTYLSTIDTLTSQINEKDQQIQELHQIIAMQQKSIQQITEQNRFLLEDQRRRKMSWWKRTFRWT